MAKKKKRKYLYYYNPHYCVRLGVFAVVSQTSSKHIVHTSIEKLARFGYKLAELQLQLRITGNFSFANYRVSTFAFLLLFLLLKKTAD